jgi:hypothetical protein
MAKSKFDAAGNIIRGLVDETALGGKLASDPRIQGIIAKNMAGMDPALAARVRAGDPEATLEAYQSIVASGGRMPARQMELPMGDGPPPNDLRATFGDQANWEETGRIAEGIIGERPMGMIPYGQRGPGVPGDLSGPGVRQPQETGMILAPPRGLPAPGQRRLGYSGGGSGSLTGPGVPLDVSDDVARAAMPDFSGVTRGSALMEPDFSAGSPLSLDMQAAKRRYDSLRYNRMPNLRNQNPQLTRIAGDGIRTKNAARQDGMARDAEFSQNARGLAAAGAGGLAVIGAANMAPDLMFGPDDTAGLAEESRPIPSVEATPDEEPAMPAPDMPPDYSFQARELMNELNAMRRQAGGEVPEAPQMMAEINRLLGMSNQRRNAPDYQPAMPTDYHGEAQRLLQKLNQMNSEMGGMSPETPKIMAEVRRLQAMGDQMRNAR